MGRFDSDIFGYKRNAKAHGVFSTDNSVLVFGSREVTDTAAYLVQSWQVQYAQQVQEIFELGSNAIYWAKSRPQGAGAISRIVGGAADSYSLKFFPEDAYDICHGGATLQLKAKGGHCNVAPAGGVKLDKGVTITMGGVVVTSVGFSMQVGDIRLLENFGWRFGYMNVDSD